MNEIVRRLRDSRAKLMFESTEIPAEEEFVEETLENNEGEISPEEDSTIESGDINTKEEIQESEEPTVCECGSTNIVEEGGTFVCDDCGRKVTNTNMYESEGTTDKKPAAIKKALEWWRAGQYQKAVELYKKYGVSDAEFSRALIGTLRESEEGVDLDAADLDESLELSVATPYVEKDGGESLRVIINGIEYRYRSNSFSISDLLKKFMGIYKHSVGQALGWLKKNSYLYYNGRTKSFVESSSMRESITIRVGNTFKNAGFDWEILSINGDYTLIYAKNKKFHPYVVAWKLDNRDGSWAQGHYFDSEEKAHKYMNSIKESADMEVISPEEKSNLDKNIIRAIQTPVSTANKPNLDSAIMEALNTEPTYDEKSLIAYLRASKESPIYIRTSKVKTGWDDVQFAASRAGYSVFKTHDKTLLQKLNLAGNFAEFYIFKKK